MNYESDPNLPDDEALFDNLDNIIDADIHDHTDAGSTYTKSQLLNGASGGVVGSVLTIPVGPGDKIDASVYAKYLAPTGTSNPTAAVGNLVLAAITGSTGTANYEGAINSSFGNEGSMITNLFSGDVSSTEPMAFINLMFLPEEVGESIDANHFAFAQVSSASSNNHALLELPETFEAPSAGYVVVYLSNESNTLSEVYFDDLQVTVRESPVIQTQDFYPFGLSFHNFNRVTVRPNRRKFNGVEQIQDLDIDMYQTLFRLYDPAIGRFHQVDPMTDFIPGITPYQFGFNNPIYFNDPDGLLFGLGRTKEERQARRRQRRLRRESRRRQRRQRRKDWHPNWNPGNPKRGNTPVGPTLATIKPSYEIGEPENNTQIVGVDIPEPPRPRPPKPDPTPPVVATTPDPEPELRSSLAGQRTFDNDPFVIRTNKWMNREVTKKFLQPYVQAANNNSGVLMRIVVNVASKDGPDGVIEYNFWSPDYKASDLSHDRKAAMEKMLIELGLKNPNQIQVQEGGTYNTKEITIEVIR